MPWIEYFRVRGFILDRKCFATRVTSLIVFMYMTSNRAYFYWLLENLHDFQTKTFLMSQINALSEVSLTPSLFVTFHGSNHGAVMTKVMIRSGYWIILTQSGKNVNNWTLIQTAVILKFQPKIPNCQLI